MKEAQEIRTFARFQYNFSIQKWIAKAPRVVLSSQTFMANLLQVQPAIAAPTVQSRITRRMINTLQWRTHFVKASNLLSCRADFIPLVYPL